MSEIGRGNLDLEFDNGNVHKSTMVFLRFETTKHRIRMLREHQKDLLPWKNDQENDYSTSLHLAAARKQDCQTVKLLLETSDIDRNARNMHGETALLLSLKQEVHETIIDLLIEHGADCNIACHRGITPLHFVASNNKANLLLKFIAKGANVDAISKFGATPLHLAVYALNYEIVRELLNNGANPKLDTILAFTPLMLAISTQNIDRRIVKLLCSYDVNAATIFGNPLFYAIEKDEDLAEELILAGADVNYMTSMGSGRFSCLLEAIAKCKKRIFDLVWVRFDQEIFRKKWSNFLCYFDFVCKFDGNDLLECLELILRSKYGAHLMRTYFKINKKSLLAKYLSNNERYELTNYDCHRLIDALPIAFYKDVFCVYKKFGYSDKFSDLLMSYEPKEQFVTADTSTSMYVDLLCYNRMRSESYNLEEISHYLGFSTPNTAFRARYYAIFSSLGVSNDKKLERLIRLYRFSDELLVRNSIASLQELSRDKVRNVLFSNNKRPYAAISRLPLSRLYKDILSLRMPIY